MTDSNIPIPQYPTQEPTSVLTNNDLILDVARKVGVAYYGSDGSGPPQVPVDSHDLYLCQRLVNAGIRMFVEDAPRPNRWRWMNIIGQVDLWPQITYDAEEVPQTYVEATFNSGNNTTTLTLTTPNPPPDPTTVSSYVPAFYQSMEVRTIWLNGNPPAGTPGFLLPVDGIGTGTNIGDPYTILQWLSATQIVVDGPLKSGYPTKIPFSFASAGDYTMPANFSGQFSGEITYISNTNRGMILHWTTEASIRERRQNYNIESGTPYACAIRLMPTPSYAGLTNQSGLFPARRRWELMTWRIASEFLHVIFPYSLQFNNLVNLTDLSPAPYWADETIRAACIAMAEKEVLDAWGVDYDYYKNTCLPSAWAIDAQSAPKRLGYFRNVADYDTRFSISDFRQWAPIPLVPVEGLS